MRRYDVAQLIACILVLLAEAVVAVMLGAAAGLLMRLLYF